MAIHADFMTPAKLPVSGLIDRIPVAMPVTSFLSNLV